MKSPRHKKTSSLVATLLVLVVLSTIVVAFMQSMAIERLTSRSLANATRAQLAANSGLTHAVVLFTRYATNDAFIVVRSGDYDYLGIASSGTGTATNATVNYLPLFSVSTNQGSNGMLFQPVGASELPVVTNYLASTNLATFKGAGLSGSNVVSSWVNVADSEGNIVSRYAFYVSDLASFVDANVAGNNTLGNPHQRTGQDPDDVALYTIFDKTNMTGVESISASIISNRAMLLSAATLRQIATPTNLYTNLSDVTLGLKPDSEIDLVPFGRGYPSEGLPKRNINSYVTNGDVGGMLAYVTNNLPRFGMTNRAGGAVSGLGYLSNLCANIIDYADSDSDPTVFGSAVRGVDSYPLVTSHYLQFQWRRVNSSGALNPPANPLSPDGSAANFWYAKNGTWHGRVDLATYVQVWNMTKTPITNGVLEIKDLFDGSDTNDPIYNRYSIFTTGNEIPCSDNPPAATLNAPKSVDFSTNALPGNAFRVETFPLVTYECDTLISTAFPRPNLSSGSPMRIGARDLGGTVDHINPAIKCSDILHAAAA